MQIPKCFNNLNRLISDKKCVASRKMNPTNNANTWDALQGDTFPCKNESENRLEINAKNKNNMVAFLCLKR